MIFVCIHPEITGCIQWRRWCSLHGAAKERSRDEEGQHTPPHWQPKLWSGFQRSLKELLEKHEGSYGVHWLSWKTPAPNKHSSFIAPRFPCLSLLRFLWFSEINSEITLSFCVFLLSFSFPIKVLSTPLLTWCHSASEILLNFDFSCSTKATWEPLKTSLKFLFPCLSKPLEIHVVLHAIVVNSASLNAIISV